MRTMLLSILLITSLLSAKNGTSEDNRSINTVAPKRESPADLVAVRQFKKQGFLTTKWCADRGLFVDCKLETLVCQKGKCFREWQYGQSMHTQLVLYVHSDLKYYYLKPSKKFRFSKLIEQGMSSGAVTIIGRYVPKSDTIIVYDFSIAK